MEEIVIVLEGGADAMFISDFIFKILPSDKKVNHTKPREFKKGKRIQICTNPSTFIFVAGGCTHIEKYNKQLSTFQDQKNKLVVVQDADDPVKDIKNGGKENRMKYLGDVKAKFDLKFETFLFPNNRDDGDLESILLQIVNDELYAPFNDCYRGYSKGVEEFSNAVHARELLEPKYLVFNYCQVYHGSKKSHAELRSYQSEYWNLGHESLDPLKQFLEKALGL